MQTLEQQLGTRRREHTDAVTRLQKQLLDAGVVVEGLGQAPPAGLAGTRRREKSIELEEPPFAIRGSSGALGGSSLGRSSLSAAGR